MLHKWCAHYAQLLYNTPRDNMEVNLDFESTEVNTIKTLGFVGCRKLINWVLRSTLVTLKELQSEQSHWTLQNYLTHFAFDLPL